MNITKFSCQLTILNVNTLTNLYIICYMLFINCLNLQHYNLFAKKKLDWSDIKELAIINLQQKDFTLVHTFE